LIRNVVSGWHGIVHSGYVTTLAELRALAVDC
jgi:hypothetical protein